MKIANNLIKVEMIVAKPKNKVVINKISSWGLKPIKLYIEEKKEISHILDGWVMTIRNGTTEPIENTSNNPERKIIKAVKKNIFLLFLGK